MFVQVERYPDNYS